MKEFKYHRNDTLPLYEVCNGYDYSKQVTDLTDSYDNRRVNLYLPVEVDTEFQTRDLDPNRASYYPFHYKLDNEGDTLTIQYRLLTEKVGKIFSHYNLDNIGGITRHLPLSNPFSIVDYLESLNITSRVTRDNPYGLPLLHIHFYGFFLLADFCRLTQGEYTKDILALVTGRTKNKSKIEHGRRLIASTEGVNNHSHQFAYLPWTMWIYEKPYQVTLSYFDCSAVHGKCNYENFCNNSGVKLDYKGVFTKEEKGKMYFMALERPTDFDNYALGDLYSYDALQGNKERFKTIYESLEIGAYFEPPRLTIGATVARMLRASLLKALDLEPKDEDVKTLTEFTKHGTAEHFKTYSRTTAVYNAKVDGGRCRNNRPTNVAINSPLADCDISGCYGNGLRNQEYPIGRPVVIDYSIDSKINDYMPLRKFLKSYRKELVPGLWLARVSTLEGYTLKYEQDFLLSWIPPKDPSKIPTDTDLETVDWFTEDNIGLIKVFSNQVNLACITEEFLDWLDNTASEKRQRKELLDNLYVITAAFYPASERCKSVEEFITAVNGHSLKNTTEAKCKTRKTKKVTIEQECHAWYSVNLGDLLVNNLLAERKKHPKMSKNDENPTDEQRYNHSMNELYKLCINTIYGDMVSPYFDVGNTIVGNNITARARAMAWYMEKGLNGFQTITDGCAFELNSVVYADDTRLTSESVYNTYTDVRKANFKLKPIGDVDTIEVFDTFKDDGSYAGLGMRLHKDGVITKLNNDDAKKWLDEQIPLHLKKLFPNIPVIDKFSFEIKDIYSAGVFHGTANYKFWCGDKEQEGKMRSYSKHDYKSYKKNGDELQLISSEYKPSEEFLSNLLKNQHTVPASEAYIATKILKTGEYKAQYGTKWEESYIFPGCTVDNARLLRACSLTQFTFRTHKQYLSWERESKRLRDKTGQTYESWFLNEDGTLDFKAMVVFLDTAIRNGQERFSKNLPSSKNRNMRREYEEHPNYKTLLNLKDKIGVSYGYVQEDDSVEELNIE